MGAYSLVRGTFQAVCDNTSVDFVCEYVYTVVVRHARQVDAFSLEKVRLRRQVLALDTDSRIVDTVHAVNIHTRYHTSV